MRLKDTNGTEHAFEESDVSVVQSAGHAFKTVPGANQEPVPAPVTAVWLKDGRSFLVDGPAGAVLAKISNRETVRSKEGW
jgi:hypothetical protein